MPSVTILFQSLQKRFPRQQKFFCGKMPTQMSCLLRRWVKPPIDISSYWQVVQTISKVVSFPQLQAHSACNTKNAKLSFQEGCLMRGPRVVVPRAVRNEMLQVLYAGHPKMKTTKLIVRFQVWWPRNDGDIPNLVRSCRVCQNHQGAPLQLPPTTWPFPEKTWSSLHVDFGGPFQGRYILLIVDASRNVWWSFP